MDTRPPFVKLEDLPTEKQDPEFWKLINHRELPRVIGFFITNTIRQADPVNLTDSQIRTQFSKTRGLQDLQDFLLTLPDQINSPEEKQTDEDKLANL